MQNDPRLYRADAVREIDRRAIAAIGDDGFVLMRRAAEAAHRRLRANWPEARRILVVAGPGNNGGDGLVLAALVRRDGLEVAVARLAGDRAPSGPAAQARAMAVAAGVPEVAFPDEEALRSLDLVVDALYGIGLSRAPAGEAARWIETVNRAGPPVLALDVPSGLDADRGWAPGVAIRATATVCFIAWKRGLWTGAGPALAGMRWLETLGVEHPAPGDAASGAVAELLGDSALRRALPRRAATAHKGHFGHVLAIGGDLGYAGAIRLAAEAAARAGAGLVSVATRPEHVGALVAGRPELMVRGIAAPADLDALLERASVLALGPGLGRSAWSASLWLRALARGLPGVIDADALNLLAQAPRALPAGSVLTPHPGEAARLLGGDTADVARDRFAAAAELARRFGAVCVLKGAGSVIANPEGRLAVCPAGNPGMASGGTGDVLTGVIAALLAQGLAPFDAAAAGTLAHARAGDRAAGDRPRGLIASDLIAELRAVLNP
jgi:NAD(P)H-hydrate epimerase